MTIGKWQTNTGGKFGNRCTQKPRHLYNDHHFAPKVESSVSHEVANLYGPRSAHIGRNVVILVVADTRVVVLANSLASRQHIHPRLDFLLWLILFYGVLFYFLVFTIIFCFLFRYYLFWAGPMLFLLAAFTKVLCYWSLVVKLKATAQSAAVRPANERRRTEWLEVEGLADCARLKVWKNQADLMLC